MNVYEMRKELNLINYDCDITREDFENLFYVTDAKVVFTFNGWDGNSYGGETKTARIYKTKIKGYERASFVKVGKGVHYITDYLVTEKATGIAHPSTHWVVNVAKKEEKK